MKKVSSIVGNNTSGNYENGTPEKNHVAQYSSIDHVNSEMVQIYLVTILYSN